jgi:hypothetical protein
MFLEVKNREQNEIWGQSLAALKWYQSGRLTPMYMITFHFLIQQKKGLSQKRFVAALENPRDFCRREKLLFFVYKLSIKTSIIDSSIATRKAANLPF